MRDVIVAGGGLAGLISSILLRRAGYDVLLIEKGTYPQHRVCGEYVSNEVLPFLRSNGLFPEEIPVTHINRFQLTSTNGNSVSIPLDLGAFGISRYAFDQHFYQLAVNEGVEVLTNTRVTHIDFIEDYFEVFTNTDLHSSKYVIGAYGKRSSLDRTLNRKFIQRKSPYIGVKYHIKTEFPDDLIALHNFKNGYCGISKVEGNAFNLCYLSGRSNLKLYGNIPEMERSVLYQNPYLASIFKNSSFIFDKPLVINEISFSNKKLIENHILMCGDTAGLITPLCGNGMAMAIHAAKLVSETMIEHGVSTDETNRKRIEESYLKKWNKTFRFRLLAGRKIQGLFGNKSLSNFAVRLAKNTPVLANKLMGLTHGKPF